MRDGEFRHTPYAFSHRREQASCGYYAVELSDDGLEVELTAAPRWAAIWRRVMSKICMVFIASCSFSSRFGEYGVGRGGAIKNVPKAIARFRDDKYITAVPPKIASKDAAHQGSNTPLPSITGASVIPY